MRELRLVLFFVVGLALGGGSVFAFASNLGSGMPPGIFVRDPDGSVRYARVPIFSPADAPSSGGGAYMRGSQTIDLNGGRNFTVNFKRFITPQSIAKLARVAAKASGPAWLGWTIAELVWDEVTQQWMKPGSDDPQGAYYWYTSGYAPCGSAAGQCTFDQAINAYCSQVRTVSYTWELTGSTGTHTVNGVVYPWKQAKCRYTDGQTMNRNIYAGAPAPGSSPASDSDIEAGIASDLGYNGMSPELTQRLWDEGYFSDDTIDQEFGAPEVSGPASVAGPTTTSTTSGPAGTTTTVTNQTYNITYQGSTVTVTNNKSSTVTAPDGSQTTTTTGTTPAADDSGSTPPEQPKSFCEENPDSIACQSMDVPAEVKPDPLEKTFSITPTGGFGGAGSCPADASLTFLGQPLSWSFKPACDFFSGVRPAVVAMAWVAAILIALGGYRKGD